MTARALPEPPKLPHSHSGRGARAGRHAGVPLRHIPVGSSWQLGAMLAIQAALSLHLAVSNTAFIDEASYINAGHAEIAHWLHGVQLPPFARSFSGAPVIYPPLAALADASGGLLGARVLSLLFMLGATALLWSAAKRLFGPEAAFFAAAIFAGTPAAQFLGAFATYDAMALVLLAAAAWCVVRCGDVRGTARIGLLGAAVACLILANAAKYASALWDPVVFTLAGVMAARSGGAANGVRTGLAMTAITSGLLLTCWAIAGPGYRAGIAETTLSRRNGGDSIVFVLGESARWAGIVTILAVAGSVHLWRKARHRDPFAGVAAWILAVAVLLAPLQQARIHSVTSLFKHVGFGAWFAAMPAGYAVCALLAAARRQWRPVIAGLCATVIAPIFAYGWFEAAEHYAGWPNSARLVAYVRPLLAHGSGPWLAEDDSVLIYYTQTPIGDWRSTWFLHYGGITGPPAYASAIRHHFFRIVILDFAHTAMLDRQIERGLRASHHYLLAAREPGGAAPGGFLIWRYAEPGTGRRRR
jgi:hypothetical protein